MALYKFTYLLPGTSDAAVHSIYTQLYRVLYLVSFLGLRNASEIICAFLYLHAESWHF